MEGNESYKTAYFAAYARLFEQHEPKETRLFSEFIVDELFREWENK